MKKNTLLTIILGASLFLPETSFGSQPGWNDWINPEISYGAEIPYIYGLDISNKQKGVLCAAVIAGLIGFIGYLLQRQSQQFPKPVTEQSLLKTIAPYNSLETAVKRICNLSQKDSDVATFINDQKNCFNLIKKLSKMYRRSDEQAAQELTKCSQAAVYILSIHKDFASLCMEPSSIPSFGKDADPIKNKCDQLYQKGFDVNFTYSPQQPIYSAYETDEWVTSLMLTISGNNQQIYEYILEKNPNINQKDLAGRTALMYACRKMRMFAVETLVKKPDINLDIKDYHGNTALMTLLTSPEIGPKIDIAKILLEKGANPTLRNKDLRNPQGAAHETRDQTLSQLIDNAATNWNNAHPFETNRLTRIC